jgi:hypothetical protein
VFLVAAATAVPQYGFFPQTPQAPPQSSYGGNNNGQAGGNPQQIEEIQRQWAQFTA